MGGGQFAHGWIQVDRNRSDGAASAGLRRVARSSREANGPLLWALRRAAGRAARIMDDPGVRTGVAKRKPVWARHGGRQRAGSHSPQGVAVAARTARKIAGQRKGADRRRRRSRKRQPVGFCGEEQRKAESRCVARFRYVDVGQRRSIDYLWIARAQLLPD